MKTCLKCQKQFPTRAKVNGKAKNLGSRKYCLDCSPFGSHNTRPITGDRRACPICGSTTNKGREKRRICYSCENKREENYKLNKIIAITGKACWICGYDKGFEMLDFHHMRDKHFELTKRNIGKFAWDDVWKEIQKCSLLCCRCHREFHAGYISKEEMDRIYKTKWATSAIG